MDGLGVHDENYAKYVAYFFIFFPDDFRLRSPVIKKNISDSKVIPLS